jgi:hypothetical protein
MKQTVFASLLNKSNINRKLVVFLGLALSTAGSQAATTSYTDRTTWETAVGGSGWVTETFTVGSDQQLVTNGILNNVGGIINVKYTTTDESTDESSDFISTDGTLHLAWDNSAAIPDGETLTLELTFDNPITAFGADVKTLDLGPLSNLKLQVNGIGPLYDLPTGAANFVGFFGLISDTAFTSLSFIDDGSAGTTQSRRFALDNASTVSAVPVPAAVWLMGSGLVGLFGIARRKAA